MPLSFLKPKVNELPVIPSKRYFSIGEVSELCQVKPHVLMYWEQEFTQLRPVKRRGNRRYYQHHEVLMIRRIRELLYNHGFTIVGARNQLQDLLPDLPTGRAPEPKLIEADANSLHHQDLINRQDILMQLNEIRSLLI